MTTNGKRALIVLLALAGMGVLLIAAVAVIVARSSSHGTTTHTVSYRVSGSTSAASLTYENANGGTEQQATVLLPWELTLGEPHRGQLFYVSAQAKSFGTVITEILVDGNVMKRSESRGEFVIATASGRY